MTIMDMAQFYAQEIEPLQKASLTQPHPNFFIVGASKSGTTSLWSYLKQHPEIAMPIELRQKEPGFFAPHYGSRMKLEKYLGIFADALGKKAIGEASTTYLSSPESANLIHDTYPRAKIIIILRNPVERAFSLYQWMLREGYEWVYPFEKALSAEEERMKDEWFEFHNPIKYHYNYLYYHSGLYSAQILRYIECFPKEHIKILLFDELKQDPRQVVHDIYEFLGVDESFMPDITLHNQAQIPFWSTGQFFFKYRIPELFKQFHIPIHIQKRLMRSVKYAMRTNLSLGRYRSLTFHPETQRGLLHRYEDDIRATSQLIARNLNRWLTPSEE